jgi:hypothetical protein
MFEGDRLGGEKQIPNGGHMMAERMEVVDKLEIVKSSEAMKTFEPENKSEAAYLSKAVNSSEAEDSSQEASDQMGKAVREPQQLKVKMPA